MIKNTTLRDSQKLLPESAQKLVKKTRVRPSRFTMKFVLGYAAALEVLKTNTLGITNVLLN